MNLNPKPCKRNRNILCGVVRNTKNCPYLTEDDCRENNATNLLGMENQRFGAITLKKYRYNAQRIKISVLEKNLCGECKVIWATPQKKCPICDREE